ncbi:MAG TPA: hypothetical protein VI072_18540 [Polyangiaceae bacterium]
MAFLLFLGALLAIVVFALVVNRLTGTKASYLDELKLEAGESELWRDTQADFAWVPRTGRALVTSYARMRRHSVVWTMMNFQVLVGCVGRSRVGGWV